MTKIVLKKSSPVFLAKGRECFLCLNRALTIHEDQKFRGQFPETFHGQMVQSFSSVEDDRIVRLEYLSDF